LAASFISGDGISKDVGDILSPKDWVFIPCHAVCANGRFAPKAVALKSSSDKIKAHSSP
jgi:hypothetical protein